MATKNESIFFDSKLDILEPLVVFSQRGIDVQGPITFNGAAPGGAADRVIKTYSTATVTPVLADAGAYIRLTNAAPTFNVPTHGSVAFPVGTQIDGIGTAGAVTFAPGGGVTIVRARTLVTVGAGSGWTLIKITTTQWDLHGDFV